MKKKILVLSSSPRKGGNSDTLCDQFIKGAEEAGHIAEKIQLHDKKIGFCIACYACRSTKACFQQDDMKEILDKMVQADVVVLATPIYYYTMNGQMKVMIDRTLPRYLEITDKDFYFIATAATKSKAQFDRTFDGFTAFLDCLDGANEKGRIYGTGVYLPGEVKDTEAMDEAYQAGLQV